MEIVSGAVGASKMSKGDNDLMGLTLKKLRYVAGTLSRGFVVEEWLDADLETRMNGLFASAGLIPTKNHTLARINEVEPWGPGNARWAWRNEDDASPTLFAPTARCPRCLSWKTTTRATNRNKRIRYHECSDCRERYVTEMADVPDVPEYATTEQGEIL